MNPYTFFISYRREDTGPIALLLKYEMEKRLQFVRVIVDVGDIKAGQQFPTRIEESICDADATIVLIGKSWYPLNTMARAPSDLQIDWVTKEIEMSINDAGGIKRLSSGSVKNKFILPIFVDIEQNFNIFDIPPSIRAISDINSEYIDYANWPSQIGSLVERIAINLNLKKRPDADEYPKADHAKARTQPVPDKQLKSTLAYEDYDGWYVDNFGNADIRYLVKIFRFTDFKEASDFMKISMEFCDIFDHHPEWRNVFNHVTVSLTTWDARRRVTLYDLQLALFMNKAAIEARRRRRANG